MKDFYKAAAVLLLAGGFITQTNAQTQYGASAGTQGLGRAFFGTGAGEKNKGTNNTFVGHQSGNDNSTGGNNTFLGNVAGQSNMSGSHNTFLGMQAGYKNVKGNDNTFVGYSAGSGSKGSQNTFLGQSAGSGNLTGNLNVAIGYNAYALGIQGNENCFMGNFTGLFNEGNYNIFIGSESGRNNKTGNENAFIGKKAGFKNTTGKWNTFVGMEAGNSNEEGTANAFFGSSAGYENKGNNNSFFGFRAGYNNTSGQFNTYLGYGAVGSPSLVNATAIGAQAKVSASNSLVLGHNANVGIGVSAPSYQLQLSSGGAAKAGSPSWKVASDKRLKKDMTAFTDGLNVLLKINPIWFKYTGTAGIKTSEKFVGVIAQDMQKIAPYTIGQFTYRDSLGNKTEYLDYDANAVTYILINAVKEQQKEIENKDVQIQQLGNDVEDLKQRLEKLESLVKSTANTTSGHNLALSKEAADEVVLEQNAPNPVSKSATIRFYIPQSVKSAALQVHTNAGAKIGTYPIEERGSGQFTFHANTLSSGMYVYHLITDGKKTGTKKMVITK